MADKRNLNEIVVRDKMTGELQIIDMYTGEVVSSAQPETDASVFLFTYEKALLVLQEIAKGKTLLELDKDPLMPPMHVIQHWQRTERMFAEEMKLARKMRAEYHYEKVMEIAENAANLRYADKEDIANAKLATDNFKWLAEKGNPERFSSKVVHEGSTEKPIVMRVINTGISRSKPDVIVEAKEVHNVEQEHGHKEVIVRGKDGDDSGAEHQAPTES